MHSRRMIDRCCMAVSSLSDVLLRDTLGCGPVLAQPSALRSSFACPGRAQREPGSRGPTKARRIRGTGSRVSLRSPGTRYKREPSRRKISQCRLAAIALNLSEQRARGIIVARKIAARPAATDAAESLNRPPLDTEWPQQLYRVLKAAQVRQVSYVPDAGHSALIRLFAVDREVVSNVLTTEEEGIAIATGAWLGGSRSVLLLQSSGVGNCVNMLSLVTLTRTPLLMLVTMRGEWAEFNPWQVPMGLATEAALKAIGITVLRAETGADLVEAVEQAAAMAFDGDQQIAVLIAQRLLGKKKW